MQPNGLAAKPKRWWNLGAKLARREPAPPRIGLALGGGFARGIAHVGVLRVFEQNNIPIHCVAGVSAGSMVAAAFAGGCTASDIEKVARSMRFHDVARWTISWMGFAGSDPMVAFLKRFLTQDRFENMLLPSLPPTSRAAIPLSFAARATWCCRFARVAPTPVSFVRSNTTGTTWWTAVSAWRCP